MGVEKSLCGRVIGPRRPAWYDVLQGGQLGDLAVLSWVLSLTVPPSCPGVRSAADLGVFGEGGVLGQECHAARRVQGPHPPRHRELCSHQPAQEQPATLCRQ